MIDNQTTHGGRDDKLENLVTSERAQNYIRSLASESVRRSSGTLDFDDFVQAASEVFIISARRFDDGFQPCEFWAFVYTRMRWHLSQLRAKDSLIAPPRDYRELRKARLDLDQANLDVTPEAIAERATCAVTPERARHYLMADRPVMSLDEQLVNGQDGYNFVQAGGRPTEEGALDRIEVSELQRAVSDALSVLAPAELRAARGIMSGRPDGTGARGRAVKKLRVSLAGLEPENERQYRGVYRHVLKNGRVRWEAKLDRTKGGERKRIYLGVFDTPRMAAQAVDRAAVARGMIPPNGCNGDTHSSVSNLSLI